MIKKIQYETVIIIFEQDATYNVNYYIRKIRYNIRKCITIYEKHKRIKGQV